MNNDLFIKRIVFEREKVEDFSKYPFSIPIVQNFKELEYQNTDIFKTYKLFLENTDKMQDYLFDVENS